MLLASVGAPLHCRGGPLRRAHRLARPWPGVLLRLPSRPGSCWAVIWLRTVVRWWH